jgi:hypothetical protein
MPDIIEIILQYLLLDEESGPRDYGQRRKCLRGQLCNYARIARPWRLPVQRILFAEVDIRSCEKLIKLRYIMSNHAAQGRFLRGCVRSLRLWVSELEKGGNLRPVDIPVAMRHFPSLYELRLDLYNVSSLGFEVMRDLQDTPSIQALMLTQPARDRYRDPDDSFGWELNFKTNVDFQLLTKVPHWKLRRFVLGNGFEVPCRESSPPKHRFEEFRFHGEFQNDEKGETSSRGINWYLQNSKRTLQVFSTSCLGYVPSMLPLESRNQLQSAEFSQLDQSSLANTTLRRLKELMWIRIKYYYGLWITLQDIIPRTNDIVHIGIEVERYYDWDQEVDSWKKEFPTTGMPSSQPLASLTNIKKISIIGFYQRKYSHQFIENGLQKMLGNAIEVRLYESLSDYKKSVVSLDSIILHFEAHIFHVSAAQAHTEGLYDIFL